MKRLKRLYVNTASSFCMIIGFIGSSEFKRILDGNKIFKENPD